MGLKPISEWKSFHPSDKTDGNKLKPTAIKLKPTSIFCTEI